MQVNRLRGLTREKRSTIQRFARLSPACWTRRQNQSAKFSVDYLEMHHQPAGGGAEVNADRKPEADGILVPDVLVHAPPRGCACHVAGDAPVSVIWKQASFVPNSEAMGPIRSGASVPRHPSHSLRVMQHASHRSTTAQAVTAPVSAMFPAPKHCPRWSRTAATGRCRTT